MALQPSLNLHLRKLAVKNVRSFAAAASPKASSGPVPSAASFHIPREELKVSKLNNNVTVASVETNKPLAKLAVYIRSGSRFETDETQGVTQMLRIATGLGTAHQSQFSTVRNIEANGGYLTCTGGREYVAYTLETGRNNMHNVEKFIKELACYQVFKPWELKDNLNRLRLERDIRSPEVRAMELIHKAAYRKGLGYSLYSPKWMIGNHSSEMLDQFVKSNFVEATVVGTGMNHEELKVFASKIQYPQSSRTIKASKFHSGSELRKETNVDLAYVALAIEGAAINNHKDVATAALVQRALGTEPRTKRGTNAGGKLNGAISGDTCLKAAATTFNANYADSGLFGVFIAATPCSVEGVTKKAAEILLAGGFADADLARAKTQLKNDIAFATESDGGFLDEIGLQSLLTGSIASPSEVDALIDSVTSADMNNLVKKGKLTMASFGKISNVPYLDQLKK